MIVALRQTSFVPVRLRRRPGMSGVSGGMGPSRFLSRIVLQCSVILSKDTFESYQIHIFGEQPTGDGRLVGTQLPASILYRIKLLYPVFYRISFFIILCQYDSAAKIISLNLSSNSQRCRHNSLLAFVAVPSWGGVDMERRDGPGPRLSPLKLYCRSPVI